MNIMCSSAQVLNSLIEQLGLLVDEEKGLKKLTIINFQDQNNLEEWPLDQLATKCFALESIEIGSLYLTTPENRTKLLEFVGKISAISQNLKEISLYSTLSSKEDG